MTSPVETSSGIAGLKGALQYVRAYCDRTFVLNAGGTVLGDPGALDRMVAQVGLLASLGIRVVLVHGGGPQASALASRLGLETRFVAGRRVTDEATLEVAKMTYAGLVNVDVLSALRAHHVQAVGLSGIDADLVTVRRRPPVVVVNGNGDAGTVDFGLVGDVVGVDPAGFAPKRGPTAAPPARTGSSCFTRTRSSAAPARAGSATRPTRASRSTRS